ncbi:beta-ribofuranosylaminobenzene 5'-phosphate synthase family protein [Halolamina pelagica]|uniref:Beta-ribofuranosylaminobenzene 5'-phosphate synthase n=1 Tax=Halolamina pelagica TaxID=699431 RepID=A0A0P7GP39_9EURY|nr:beta-ribofuranosylaminobenzene 5'-phosphate synthase family protein [Halolamina pelagica]KPN30421.1 beta-ribofuranosylaminobenzene 5'-phosphate synthase family protein [Halolamina pelagica]
MARVETSGRLHFGFGNLSLAHDRLYGALGVAIDQPRLVVEATTAETVQCADDAAAEYAERVCELLSVPGAAVTVESHLPRHAGLGSGTQLALAVLSAIARAYGRAPAARERAPELGRGGRSGIGIAAFEQGGFVLDAGHPSALFTSDAPAVGEWEVPPVATRHPIPDHWRFLVVVPDAAAGRSGDEEDAAMRRAVTDADPELADRVAGVVVRGVLPAIADGDAARFGDAVSEVGRLNGAWYADEQGGTYRPPVGSLVDSLSGSAAVYGAGQSSWGPIVYGVTDAAHADAARAAGREALAAAGVDGDVFVAEGHNRGASIDP